MIDSLVINIPTQVTFGCDALSELPKLLSSSGVNRTANILLITSFTVANKTLVKNLIHDLEKYGTVLLWNQVAAEPAVDDADLVFEHFFDKGITHVLGVGGGSVMDLSKALALAIETGLSVRQLLSKKFLFKRKKVTLILAPTTAGTGSEVSFGAILTDRSRKIKVALRGAAVAADFAFVDPRLTLSLPVKLTMLTGFDVLTHAIETYVSRRSTVLTELYASEAIKKIFNSLPILYQNPSNLDARVELSYASMLMGINLAHSTTCLPHRMQYVIGCETSTSHAEGLVAIYPAWLGHVVNFAPEKFRKCADWIGVSSTELSEQENAFMFVEFLKKLMKDVGLNLSLDDFGLHVSEVAELSGKVQGLLSNDPSFRGVLDVEHIFRSSFNSVKT